MSNDDLDTLRPEVREAMDAVTSHFAIAGADLPGAGAWRMCRDELLRLAAENASMRAAWHDTLLTGTGILKVERVDPATVMLPVAPRHGKDTHVPQSEHEALAERAERAEAENADFRRAFADLSKRYRACEAELAALKARIAGSCCVTLTKVALGNGCSLTVSASMSVNDVDDLHGKRVRLLVED